MSERSLITVLVPVYNEEDNVARAHAAVVRVFQDLASDYDVELLFTDNGSTDQTAVRLRAIAAADSRVRVIRFSRNFGYQKSILHGYRSARGDAAIQLDCDLQDPPELIPEFLRRWREGNQVVYGIRRRRPEEILIHAARRSFYRLIDALSEDHLPKDAGDFRLVDRRVLAELRRIDDATPYVRGLIASVGFTQVGVPYDRQVRAFGSSKFPLRELLRLALDGLVSHSLMPLRFASLAGLALAGVTALAIVGYFAGRFLFGQDWPAGFATTTILLLLSVTLNAVFLGIIGEYLARIYLQVRRRPLVIVAEEYGGTATTRKHQG